MKTSIHGLFFLLLFLNASILSFGQFITREEMAKYKSWPRFHALSQLYAFNDSNFIWINQSKQREELFDLLHLSSSLALNEADYQGAFIQSFRQDQVLQTKADSVEAELRFSDAALHFFTEIQTGNRRPSFGYTGLKYSPDISSLPAQIASHLRPGGLKALLNELQPRSKEYHNTLQKLNWFRKVVNDDGFAEVKITSKKVDSGNRLLLRRLYQLGITEAETGPMNSKELVQKLKAAQEMFDLSVDGVIGNATLNAFNTPLKKRIDELILAVNYLCWLENIKQTSVLILNIPAAHLMVYNQGDIILDSKVIVGKSATPTPTLTSTITEVILYPYWNVPFNIATKELLPAIKRNVGYLSAKNYQVINRQGKVVNPYSLNWHSFSTAYFPYVIRQSTGCDNALGLVKFNFYNPFTVYLHDTPGKDLFLSGNRFFSHGCMRVEKPSELAHLLLGKNRIAIDTLTAKGCVDKQAPIVVPIETTLPVIILYSTVWYNKDGAVRFYTDVYGKLN